ncbi:MAG TPA: hypothetical protein VJU86_01485 [Pyrinomonadaceae bacterium]|nr:hypothetical protein [Pyrinomonadaceae bacterium]
MKTLPLGEDIVEASSSGKITASDARVARILTWLPWLSVILVSVPLPIVFLLFFLTSVTTDSAAVYLLLSFVSLAAGLVVGLILLILLSLYRNRWNKRLRDRLAVDGITANEVSWFETELTSEERKAWRELKAGNPLLADAYCETLAARLTASRIAGRARTEMLRIERQLNRTRALRGVDTSELMDELTADRQRVDRLRLEAVNRVSYAKARLQTIEAAAHRALSQSETESMLRRLVSSQEQFPLALEMANLEREALTEVRQSQASKPGSEDGNRSLIKDDSVR